MKTDIKLKSILYAINNTNIEFVLKNGKLIIADLKVYKNISEEYLESLLEAFKEIKNSFARVGSRGGRPLGQLKYSPEQIEFLKTFSNLSIKETNKRFNEEFGTNIKLDSQQLYQLMIRQGILTPSKEIKSSEEVHCPTCGSKNFRKRGFRTLGNNKKVQIYLCKDCKRKFSGSGKRYRIIKDEPKVVKKKPKKITIYTKGRLKFLRDNYCKTETTRDELRDLFNEKFGVNISSEGIKGALRDHKIKKDEEYLKNLRAKQFEKNKKKIEKSDEKKKGKRPNRKPQIYTQEVVGFIRQCASQGMTAIETKQKCQLEFEHPFNINSLKMKASQEKITFARHRNLSLIEDFDPEIVEFIKKNKDMEIYELRDEIIIKFEKDILIKNLRSLVDRMKIKDSNEESVEAEVKKIEGLKEKEVLDSIGEDDIDFTEDLE